MCVRSLLSTGLWLYSIAVHPAQTSHWLAPDLSLQPRRQYRCRLNQRFECSTCLITECVCVISFIYLAMVAAQLPREFCIIPRAYPRPVILRNAFRRPSVIVGPALLLHPSPPGEERQKKDAPLGWALPAPSPSPVSPASTPTSSHPPPAAPTKPSPRHIWFPPEGQDRGSCSLAPQGQGKGARGCFHPHAFPCLSTESWFAATRPCTGQRGGKRNCLSPLPHHQHPRAGQAPGHPKRSRKGFHVTQAVAGPGNTSTWVLLADERFSGEALGF